MIWKIPKRGKVKSVKEIGLDSCLASAQILSMTKRDEIRRSGLRKRDEKLIGNEGH